jgi:hypothetical protein
MLLAENFRVKSVIAPELLMHIAFFSFLCSVLILSYKHQSPVSGSNHGRILPVKIPQHTPAITANIMWMNILCGGGGTFRITGQILLFSKIFDFWNPKNARHF